MINTCLHRAEEKANSSMLLFRHVCFVVKGKKTAIYIDGAAFHTGSRLRRDRYIRDRLRAGSQKWKVIELAAGDLRRGDDLISVLKDAS